MKTGGKYNKFTQVPCLLNVCLISQNSNYKNALLANMKNDLSNELNEILKYD